MDKKSPLDYIESFLNNSDVFFGKITGQSFFDKVAFELYTMSVYKLAKTDLSLQDKYGAVILIWEISYKIQDLLGSHLDPYDILYIENLEEDDIRQISNLLYYTANWFSYGKEIEENLITIGSWA